MKPPINSGYGLKPKDLVGIPWMVAFALRADGWYLRQDIIWHKPNPMPESVTDRCTKSHEYIFLMSKSQKYYYDAESIKTDIINDEKRPSGTERNREKNYDSKENNNPEAYRKKVRKPAGWDTGEGSHGSFHREGRSKETEYTDDALYLKANKRSVWTVNTKGYKGAHFATFPEKLIVDCIKAGCPEKKLVCDCCGYELSLSSNTNANEAIYEELQDVWNRISGNRQVGEGENILHKKMQLDMDGQEQNHDKGLDNNEQRIQDDIVTKSPEQNEIWLYDGASACDGKEDRKISNQKRDSSSFGREQTEQQEGKPTPFNENSPRQITKTTSKTDNLSSLWEENKSIGACPQCAKGQLIGQRGIILDCFMGAGTTALVARKLNRNYIGLELNKEDIDMADKRLYKELGAFA